jgi:hypothetical protein
MPWINFFNDDFYVYPVQKDLYLSQAGFFSIVPSGRLFFGGIIRPRFENRGKYQMSFQDIFK